MRFNWNLVARRFIIFEIVIFTNSIIDTFSELIEPVKQMFATLVKRKQVWQHQSHPGDGFFDRRKRWRRQNEERQARMYYSSKQYMADAAGFEFPHNRYFNYPVY